MVERNGRVWVLLRAREGKTRLLMWPHFPDEVEGIKGLGLMWSGEAIEVKMSLSMNKMINEFGGQP